MGKNGYKSVLSVKPTEDGEFTLRYTGPISLTEKMRQYDIRAGGKGSLIGGPYDSDRLVKVVEQAFHGIDVTGEGVDTKFVSRLNDATHRSSKLPKERRRDATYAARFAQRTVQA